MGRTHQPIHRSAPKTGQIVDGSNWHLADNPTASVFVRFSNRPFGVKHFQTIHHCSVDVAHGLVLLFGIGTKALPVWDSKTRRNNLSGGLAVRVTVGPSGHTNSPHPSSREGHHSTTRWRPAPALNPTFTRGKVTANSSVRD